MAKTNLQRICEYFNKYLHLSITTDDIIINKAITHNIEANSVNENALPYLMDEESEILQQYRSLNPENRKALNPILLYIYKGVI